MSVMSYFTEIQCVELPAILVIIMKSSRKIPESFLVWLEVGMHFRVSVPSDVPHPDIKPSIGKEIGETLIG